MAALVLASVVFVGTHFLLSHPLRAPLAGRMGERLFQAFYSLVAAATFVPMIYFYGKIGREAPLWSAGDALWLLASLLMWFGSILFVGSFMRNPALPGARRPKGAPTGVFRITRHPMMWGFALWAIVHILVEATPKALVLDGAILFLALVGAAAQDRKKQGLMGERWHEWRAQTAFTPFAKGGAYPGTTAFVGGTLLFFLATWFHPLPAGFWRWIG
ncbi:NnrU family protein [Sphingomonas telluris]|nr:NnrU family protein [Sphingomonas telluris]